MLKSYRVGWGGGVVGWLKILVTAQVLGFLDLGFGLDFGLGLVNR